MNRPNPDKAVKVRRGSRYAPKGVKVCATNIRRMTVRELRIFQAELDGKPPEWTYSGKCFRPTGRWHDTNAGGEYVTANAQEIIYKRRVMKNQDVCVLSVMSGVSFTLKRVTITDINTEAGRKYGKIKGEGHNIPVCYDDNEWVVYV
jgi:hypothetical protein